MGSRALGQGKWHSSSQQSKINEVTTTLVYPMSITTTPTDTYGLSITGGGSAPANQQALTVNNSAGNPIYVVPNVGGPKAPGGSHRVYNNLTQGYAALNGAVNPPALELPDRMGQGSKIWSGSGDPAYNLAQGTATAAIGDIYFCRSSAFVVASSFRASSTTCYVGSSTPTLGTSICANGAIANGDLVVAVVNSTNTSMTATMGATATVTATSTDGGLTTSITGFYNRVFSHVIQSGDISSGQFEVVLSASMTGTNPSLVLYVFRHPNGWATTGSLFGAAMYGTPYQYNPNTTNTSNITMSVTGPSRPSVSIASCYQSVATSGNGHTYSWNDTPLPNYNNVFVEYPDYPVNGGAIRTSACAKPGTGPNQSAFPAMGTGSSSVVLGNVAGKQVASLVMYQANGTSNPIMYYCTGAGTPGTWTAIL